MVDDLVWKMPPLVGSVMVVVAVVVVVVRGRGHGGRGKVVRLAAGNLVRAPGVHLELITVERVGLTADHCHIF